MSEIKMRNETFSEWVSSKDRMPPSETHVLCICNGEHRVLSRELESDGYESTYPAFWYWNDPGNCGLEISDNEVTHWMILPDAPPYEEEFDQYGNPVSGDRVINCCFPDCGCDGARLCQAENGAIRGASTLNIERGSLSVLRNAKK